MELGTPTMNVIGKPVTLVPVDITVNPTAEVATNVKFHEPIYLEAGEEYALVLLSDSTEYTVWISRIGEADVTSTTAAPDPAPSR